MTLISEAIQQASQKLSTSSESPRLDAEILLCHCLHKNRTWLMTWADKPVDATQLTQFQHLLQRRINGEPIAHITGTREFWSLDLQVTADTLIPRPDTELLVEQVLQQHTQTSPFSLLDLGTGSGAIALAIASERPQWNISASDNSDAALQVAQANAQSLDLSQIEFIHSHWFEKLHNRCFDVIVSNPPYIPCDDPHLSQGDVRFEPMSALASGTDGLDDIRHICDAAPQYLSADGYLYIEHGYDQKNKIYDIFVKNKYKNIQQQHDLAGNPRITFAKKP